MTLVIPHTRVRPGRPHFGDVDLGGLRCAIAYAWPGAVFEGKGEYPVIIDERANDAQRAALDIVLHGGETDEAATHWWVFHAMCDTVHPTLYAPIEFEVDIEARTGRVAIPGLLESTGRPIRNPVDGGEHRVRIDLPDGIEFEIAEVGSASTRSTGLIPSSSTTASGSSIGCVTPGAAWCAEAASSPRRRRSGVAKRQHDAAAFAAHCAGPGVAHASGLLS